MRYLFPIDFSESSIKAFKTGIRLIDPKVDEIVLLSICEVYQNTFLNTIRVDFDFQVPNEHRLIDSQILHDANKNIIKDTQGLVAEFETQLVHKFGDQIKIETLVVKEGDPKAIICETSEKKNIDVIVMGSRGLSPIKKMVMGSVSDYCLQNAKAKDIIIVH
eukprot:TRINITY_DN1663_c0_g1_i1.p1 TRINITY_DN1663_c0_g1~~TRINITY_DN1663_c0_g1_i1.p1  ORF type:complete len:162 (-),score=44.47 TRINITY_DN1663_c0_g1_i1:28-513(-)